MRKPLNKGDIVKSKRGHDIGRIYLVCDDEADGFVWLIDGEYRKANNKKHKRTKHLKFLAKSQSDLKSLNDEQLDLHAKKTIREITT